MSWSVQLCHVHVNIIIRFVLAEQWKSYKKIVFYTEVVGSDLNVKVRITGKGNSELLPDLATAVYYVYLDLYVYHYYLNTFYSEQHSRQQAKHTWRTVPASTIASSRTLCLRLAANDHNWWTAIPRERHQQSGSRKRKEQKMKPVHYFQVPSLSCETFLAVDVEVNNVF